MIVLAALTLAGLVTATAFLASYAAENGLPVDLSGLFAAKGVQVAHPLRPVWCERTRRWRDPVSRAFVKAPTR